MDKTIHRMTVDGLCEVIREFYKVQKKLSHGRLNRKNTWF